MGWTVNQSRRRDRLRRRPHLEHLDDRCLLSTGLEGSLIATPTLREHATEAIRTGHHDAMPGKGGELVVRFHGRAHAHRERPAGTMTATTSAGAPYDTIIGASQVQSSYNVDGSGMTVAVIDTGVDYNNPALGSGYGPGAKVIAGYDFADNSTNPMAVYSQHGTAVAGIIGSDNASDPGVAPGVNIVALRVTDSTNTASLSSIANALQWVITNHAQYNITVVNLSLSDGNNYAHNWFATTGGAAEQVTNLIGQLRGMNIPVVVATGNSFTGTQGEGFAAIVQGTISVTATDLDGNFLPDAQRLGTSIGGSSATVIAAPGEGFTAPSGDNGSSSVDGTSFATPLVSGAIVLLQQIYEERFGTLPTVDQIQSWLQGGSDPLYDPVTGITIGELDIPKAAALIPTAAAAIAPAPSITSTLQVSTASVAPTSSNTTTQTTTTVTAPPAPTTPTVTTTAVSSPTPTPPPTSAPSPPPATSNQQVISEAGDPSDASGNSVSGSVPPAVSGLALLLQSMKVWAASSSRG
jgi:subtilisin family serine protease